MRCGRARAVGRTWALTILLLLSGAFARKGLAELRVQVWLLELVAELIGLAKEGAYFSATSEVRPELGEGTDLPAVAGAFHCVRWCRESIALISFPRARAELGKFFGTMADINRLLFGNLGSAFIAILLIWPLSLSRKPKSNYTCQYFFTPTIAYKQVDDDPLSWGTGSALGLSVGLGLVFYCSRFTPTRATLDDRRTWASTTETTERMEDIAPGSLIWKIRAKKTLIFVGIVLFLLALSSIPNFLYVIYLLQPDLSASSKWALLGAISLFKSILTSYLIPRLTETLVEKTIGPAVKNVTLVLNFTIMMLGVCLIYIPILAVFLASDRCWKYGWVGFGTTDTTFKYEECKLSLYSTDWLGNGAQYRCDETTRTFTSSFTPTFDYNSQQCVSNILEVSPQL